MNRNHSQSKSFVGCDGVRMDANDHNPLHMLKSGCETQKTRCDCEAWEGDRE